MGSLVLGASACEVESFSEAIGPLAAVGFAKQVESHQVEQLGEADSVGEGADAVAGSAIDLSQDLLDRAGRVQSVGVAAGDLRPGDVAVAVDPLDRERERTVLAVRVLDADRMLESVPRLEAVEGIQEGAADRVGAVGKDLVREVLAKHAPEVPFTWRCSTSSPKKLRIVSARALSASLTITFGARSKAPKNAAQAATS